MQAGPSCAEGLAFINRDTPSFCQEGFDNGFCQIDWFYTGCNYTCAGCTEHPSAAPASSTPTAAPSASPTLGSTTPSTTVSTTPVTTITSSATSTASTTGSSTATVTRTSTVTTTPSSSATTTDTSTPTTTATTTAQPTTSEPTTAPTASPIRCSDATDLVAHSQLCATFHALGHCDPGSDNHVAFIARVTCQFTCEGCTTAPTFVPTAAPATPSPTRSPVTPRPSLAPTARPSASPSAPSVAPTLIPTTSDTIDWQCPVRFHGGRKCEDARIDLVVVLDTSGSNLRNLGHVRRFFDRLLTDITFATTDRDFSYLQAAAGNCIGHGAVESAAECAAAAAAVGLADTVVGDSSETSTPYGCYVREGHLFFNPHGDAHSVDAGRPALCRAGAGVARFALITAHRDARVHIDFEEGRALGEAGIGRHVNRLLDEQLRYPDGYVTGSNLSQAFRLAAGMIAADGPWDDGRRPVSAVGPTVVVITDGLHSDTAGELAAAQEALRQASVATATIGHPEDNIHAVALEPVVLGAASARILGKLRELAGGHTKIFQRPTELPAYPSAGTSEWTAHDRFFSALARNFLRTAVCCRGVPDCGVLDTDIALLIDVAAPGGNTQQLARAVALRAFAAMVVAGIPVRTGGSRVGMVTFGDAEETVQTVFGFTSSIQLSQTRSLSTAITSTGPHGTAAAVALPPSTQLGDAFAHTAQDLFGDSWDRGPDETAPARRDPIVLALLGNPPGASSAGLGPRNMLLDASGAAINIIGVSIDPGNIASIATDDGAAIVLPDTAGLTPQYAAEIRNSLICRDVATDPPTQAPTTDQPTTTAPTAAPTTFRFQMHFGSCADTVAGTQLPSSAGASTGGGCHAACAAVPDCVAFQFDPSASTKPCSVFTRNSTGLQQRRNDVSFWQQHGPGAPESAACFLRL